ncbi:hypothetical protein F5X99DRAFT_394975 [Biscogniauxia marginata]|nr:hypothetical protein F5X99DRAFT_394975 [Biscogniauxia marginata]
MYYHDTSGYDLAYRLARYHHHPTIVNGGDLVVDDRTLRYSGAIVYNSPGSTMHMRPSRHHSSTYNSYYYPTPCPPPAYVVCRGCYHWRENWFSRYCRDCTSERLRPLMDRRPEHHHGFRRIDAPPERGVLPRGR